MARALSLDAHNEVDAAISRVLEAERAAQQDVEAARREAADIAEAARAAVRDLDARTERRIRRLRAAFAARTDGAVAELERAARGAEGVGQQPVGEDERRIARAVAQVAEALTASAS